MTTPLERYYEIQAATVNHNISTEAIALLVIAEQIQSIELRLEAIQDLYAAGTDE